MGEKSGVAAWLDYWADFPIVKPLNRLRTAAPLAPRGQAKTDADYPAKPEQNLQNLPF
jgi:hypothetical protein